MVRNKGIAIACEEFGLKQSALPRFLNSCHFSSLCITTGSCCAGDAQRTCADVDSSVHMTLSWHSSPFPVCFSALQQMKQKPYVKSSTLVCSDFKEEGNVVHDCLIVPWCFCTQGHQYPVSHPSLFP